MNTPSDAGVRQLKNGCWAYQFSISINGQKISKRGSTDCDGNPLKTKGAAIKARKHAIKLTQLAPLLPVQKKEKIKKKTVSQVFDEYCEKGRSDRAYNTILKQDSLWENHLKSAFGEKLVEEIEVADISDYLAKLYYEEEYAYRYVESFLKMFYLIFGQAYSRGYLSVDRYNRLCVNKDTKIHMPKLKTDDDLDIVAFSNEECAVMDKHFSGSNAETAYLLGRYCGLRINECYGLKWQNIDLEHGTIRIEQQMQYQNGLVKLVPLKTRNAKRTIFMNSIVKAHFTALSATRADAERKYHSQREQNQTIIIDTDDSKISCLELVNTLPNGKIQTVNSMKYHSRTLKSAYGINFKYHYLRHTYGTQLAVLNTPAHLLCNQMGHGNIHVTERYYIALSNNGIEVLKRNLEQL